VISSTESRLALRTSRTGLCLLALTLGLFLVPAGCNIFGPAFILVHGPPRVPSEYELDKSRVTTVLVDDQNTILPRRQYRVVIAKGIEQRLLDKKKLAVDMIDSQAVLASVNREKPGERRSVPEIGRDVGAEVVIWVTFDAFTLSPDGQTFHPVSVARVKVVDADEGTVLWPEEPTGHRLVIELDTKATTMPDSHSQRTQIERQLAEYTGKAISELFYEVEKPFSARAGNE
jgi:hypothetical protein